MRGTKIGKKATKKILNEVIQLGLKDSPKYTFYGKRKGGSIIKTETKGHIFSHNVPKLIIRITNWLIDIDASTEQSESGSGSGRKITFYVLSPQAGIFIEVDDQIAGTLDIPGNHVYKMDIYTQNADLVKQVVKIINEQWDDGIIPHLDFGKIEKKYKVSTEEVTNGWNQFLS